MLAWFDKIEPLPEAGCWIWLGELNRNGYGRGWLNGVRRMVHRALYEALISPIPKGLVLDHRCRVRCCVNPYHCEPVTVQVNTHRGEARLFRSESHAQH